MDRCRCEEYEAAVKKLRFYTLGTLRPDIIDNYNRGELDTKWISTPITPGIDLKFQKPFAFKKMKMEDLPQFKLPKHIQRKEKMWCPFMTPVIRYSD